MTAREWFDAYCDEQDLELLVADGWDEAILGVASRAGTMFVVYDTELILKTLVERDGMTRDEAVEYFQFTIALAYVGPSTPAFFVRWGEANDRPS